MSPDGALYVGAVVHRRARPKRHHLRYSVFSILLDLDRLETLSGRLRLFSVGRFNLFSLQPADFGPRDGSSLAAFVRRRAAAAGVGELAGVAMLCYPRLLGYAFNPITVYFGRDAAGTTVYLLYEVRNTFGEVHFYDAAIAPGAGDDIRHEAAKAFYVSPFNTLEGRYRFTIRPPGDTVFTGVTLSDDQGGLVTAFFSGAQRPLTDLGLLRVAVAFPLMTFKVVAAIHWHALRLWLKGVPHTLSSRSGKNRSRATEIHGQS